MRRLRLICMMAAIIALTTSGIIRAQEIVARSTAEPRVLSVSMATPFGAESTPLLSPVSDEYTRSLEERVLRLESQFLPAPSASGSSVSNELDREIEQQQCGSGGLFGSIEVTFLRPRLSGATPAFTTANGGRVIENDYRSGVRYVLGYRTDDGFGIRGRYWSYDHAFPFAPPFAPAQLSIQAQAADLEFLFSQQFRNYLLELSTGLRYGQLRYWSPTAGGFGVGEASFEGLGPTVAADLRRSLGQSGLSVYGNVRGSMLFGEIRNASMLVNMPRGPIRDEVMSILENQLGVAWSKSFRRGSTFEVHAAWETQYWMNDTFSDDAFGIGSNLAFMGPTVGAEFRY